MMLGKDALTAQAPPEKLTPAERQRRYRARRASLDRIVPVCVDVDLVEDLIAARYLEPGRDEDREAIGDAIGRFVREKLSRYA